jgi:hypothetical protein
MGRRFPIEQGGRHFDAGKRLQYGDLCCRYFSYQLLPLPGQPAPARL